MSSTAGAVRRREATEEPLDDHRWAYETSRFVACGYDFSIRLTDVSLGRFLDEVWAPTSAPGEPAHRYSLVDRGDGGRPTRFSLWCDDDRVITTDRPSMALGMLSWHVNRAVVAGRGDHLVLHAAGAEHRGRAVIIPAVMESGKTTLVAGLTRAGLRYLTDEAVFVEPGTLRVDPYLKPLSVDPGSWSVLASMRPEVHPDVAPFVRDQWQVPASAIRPDAVGEPCLPSFIVTTSYQPGQPTSLTPLSASEAVVALASNTFGFEHTPAHHLEVIAAVVRRCRRYRLVVSDLGQACDLVLDLLEDS